MTAQTSPTADGAPAQAPDLRDQLFGAQEWYTGLVESADDSRLHATTPCIDFDVRMLQTHMSTVFEKIVGLAAEGRDPYLDHDRSPEAMVAEREKLAADVVDGVTPADRAARLREQLDRAKEVWTDDVLDRPITLGWGPVLPGRVVAAIYLMEVLAHGVDLAIGTGQGVEAPPQVAEPGLAAAKMALPEHPRGMENGFPFDPAVEPAADAGPTERLANWTGRVTR